MRIRPWSAIAAVLLLAASGGPKPGLPQQHSGSKPDTSGIEINGDASDPVNKLAIEAIADLQKYWGEEYPKTYEGDYQPVKGGFFAVLPSSGDLPPAPRPHPTSRATRSTARTETSSRGTPSSCFPN